jgi:hypothetical protein
MRRIVPVLLLLLPTQMLAQKFPVVGLGKPDASLDEEFTSISSVRELSDGRVIITDATDRGIVVADLRTGRVAPISRKGNGPGEYDRALPVRPLAGDSSIMLSVSRRWLLFDGTKSVVSMPPDSPVILATRGFAQGADSLGNVIGIAVGTAVPGPRDIGKADSTTIIRATRATGKVDTVVRLLERPRHFRIMTEGGRAVGSRSTIVPLTVGEECLLFRDGWLAVARLDPYRIDWRSPDGRWILGKSMPLPVARITEGDKRAFRDRVAPSWKRIGQSPDTISEWPDVLPP